jgi:transcriptional regulator GlxA family with amidase domain
MARTVILVFFADAVLSSVIAPLDIFTRTNGLLQAQGRPAAFDVHLLTLNHDAILGHSTSYQHHSLLSDFVPAPLGHTQCLIVIPAFMGEWDEVCARNSELIHWLQLQYRHGSEIASLCKGSYFLAAAGLLNGLPCTSHWAVADDLQRRFPAIKVQSDAVVTDQSGVYTGGGAFSSLNLILYLIEKFCGQPLGVQVAKQFSIQRDHINQAHFAMFNGLTRHNDKSIRSAQEYIESNYRKPLSIDDIAAQVNMSKRNFVRRFKQAINLTPAEYIQRVKIEAAKKILETHRTHIIDIIYDLGYNDIKTFRDTFKRITGITPQDYRKKYSHEI